MLDAYIAMVPKTSIVFGPLVVWCSLGIGSSLGLLTRFSALVVVVGSVEAWYATALDIEEVLAGAADSHVHLFVADVIKSFDTVDRGSWIGC